MPNPNQGIGFDEHVGLTGGAATKNGLGDAMSEATGFEFDKADGNYSPDVGWKADSVSPADTRLLYTFARTKAIGAGAAPISGMTGVDDAYRWRWSTGKNGGFMEKPAAPFQSGTSADNGITEVASWTLIVLFRAAPLELIDESSICEIRATGASSDTTRLVQVRVGSTRQLAINLPRMSGVEELEETTGQIDDCDPHWIEIVFTDSGGSGGDAVINMDGVQVGTLATSVTFASQPGTGQRIALDGNHHVGGVWLFNSALSAADLTRYRYGLRTGKELDLEASINVSETSGTTLADSTTNGHDVTLGAGTFGTVTNPGADHNPDAAARHQPWRVRSAYAAHLNGATTTTDLDASPVVSHWFWYRSEEGAADAAATFSFFGTTDSAGDFDWLFRAQTDGSLRCAIGRFLAGTLNLDTGDVSDGELHGVSLLIGHGVASIGVAGVEVASGAVSDFVVSSASKYQLMPSTNHRGQIGGPVGIAQRAHTHAEMYDFLTGAAVVIPSPSTSPAQSLLYTFNEGTGTTAENRGLEASGDLTVTSADWLVDEIENPAPGPLRDVERELSIIAWEIAPGTLPECGEFLLELFVSEASEAPLVLSLLMFDVLWPSVQGFASGSDNSTGPRVDVGAAGGTFPDARIAGRSMSYRMPKLTFAEERTVRAALARASQIWRGGDLVTAKPIALLDRGTDRNEWVETSDVVAADPPRVTISPPDHGRSIRRGLEVGGQQWFPVE